MAGSGGSLKQSSSCVSSDFLLRAMRFLKDFLLTILFAFFLLTKPVEAMPAWPFSQEAESTVPTALNVADSAYPLNLQEVPPPEAVQQIIERLDKYHPKLSFVSPSQGEVLQNEGRFNLVLHVEDWPLVDDPELGLGPHVVVQFDDDPPIRTTNKDEGNIVVPIDGLSPGSHRISAYAAYPWGESVKGPVARAELRIHVVQKLQGSQPELDEPWLTVVSPSELSSNEPFLIDYLIWNSPLQGLKEGDDRWRMRVTVNGESFLLDRQEPIWLNGLTSNKSLVQFELLDGLGEPIKPFFNNLIRLVEGDETNRPNWIQSHLSEYDLSRLVGDSEFVEVFELSNDQPGGIEGNNQVSLEPENEIELMQELEISKEEDVDLTEEKALPIEEEEINNDNKEIDIFSEENTLIPSENSSSDLSLGSLEPNSLIGLDEQ